MSLNYKFYKFLIFSFIKCSLLYGFELKDGDDFLLENKKAGKLIIGMKVDDLYKNYSYDMTKVVDLFKEGTFSPAIEIYLNGKMEKPSIVAEIGCFDGFLIDRINIYDKKFKTKKGIGVGSKLKDLKKSYKIDWIDYIEGKIFIRIGELDISFVLKIDKIPDQWFEKKDINLIPENSEISYIIIN